jgi:hypothetical protein
MTNERDQVTGTHRPTVAPLWLLWSAIGAVSGVLAVASALQSRWVWVGISALLLASSTVNLVILRTAGTTTVSPEGLRVRRGFGWRSYTWDEVVSIDRPRTILGYDTGLTVRTRAGDTVPLAVPPRLRDALVDYREHHRARHPLSPN